ncbi:MAG: hypothetical protein Q8T13_23790 [Acidobacteriota bacterium]|nr:hypothetical protein [Acidobacteriota bacterium]
MKARLRIVPCDLDQANSFVARHHRHHPPVRGHKFSVAVVSEVLAEVVVGVAIVGRPNARGLDDGWTLEVTRNCTDGTRNACSALYGACARAAFALGYTKLITYIGSNESGLSLKASGFKCVAEVKGRSWSCPSRPRVEGLSPLQDKLRWEVMA